MSTGRTTQTQTQTKVRWLKLAKLVQRYPQINAYIAYIYALLSHIIVNLSHIRVNLSRIYAIIARIYAIIYALIWGYLWTNLASLSRYPQTVSHDRFGLARRSCVKVGKSCVVRIHGYNHRPDAQNFSRRSTVLKL